MKLNQYVQLYSKQGSDTFTSSVDITSPDAVSGSMLNFNFNFDVPPSLSLSGSLTEVAARYNSATASISPNIYNLTLLSSSFNGSFSVSQSIGSLITGSDLVTQQSLIGDSSAILSGTTRTPVVSVVPTGSYSVGPVSGSPDSSTYYLDAPNNPIGLLQYAINNIEEGSSNPTGSLCLRLPAPSTGQTVIVNNNTPRNLRIFTSSSIGRFTEGSTTAVTIATSGSAFILPPGPQSARFECVQNPTQGVWNVTFPPGTVQDITCEFHIDHIFGSSSKASFNITPNSTNPDENRAMKVRMFGTYDQFTGGNVRGTVKYFDIPQNYGAFSTSYRTYPDTDSTSVFHISPTEVRDPNDFFTQFLSPHTYIDRVQLHSNITSSDYHFTSNLNDGGLYVLGIEQFISDHPTIPGGIRNHYNNNFLFYPPIWQRDIYVDQNIQTLVNSGQVAPQNAFELERASSNTNPNVPSEINRVVPSENPPPYDPTNPQIGALYTEYYDSQANPNNYLNTNPLNVGALNGRSIPFVRENVPGTNNFVDTTDHFAPVYSFHLDIPSWYATKTYKFRMITTIRTA